MDEFPEIPEHLIPSIEKIKNSQYFGNHPSVEKLRHPFELKNYSTRKINQELKEWLVNNFKFDFVALYIIFDANMLPHKDLRNFTYNYIIDAGGNNIHTNVFSGEVTSNDVSKWHQVRCENNNIRSELTLLESVCLEEKRWHYLRTDLNHSVTGDHTHSRVILSLTPVSAIIDNNKIATDWYIENWKKDNWKC